MAFTIGQPVWAADSVHGFVEGKIIDKQQSKITVETVSYCNEPATTKDFTESELQERVVFPSGSRHIVQDMDELQTLNMAEVLDNVDSLFQLPQEDVPGRGPNTIYSCAGPVLIAMNPFRSLPCFGDAWLKAYHEVGQVLPGQVAADMVNSRKLGPHIYLTAENSYRGLWKNKNQSIVICGESGAGKTWTVRMMLNFLCQVAQGSRASADPEKITMSNELAEAFGNAKTTRNHNSSRFGKFTKLYCAKEGAADEAKFTIQGCGAAHYLLERSRIVSAPPEERNYHIFYQLLRSGESAKYNLEADPSKYKFTELGANETPPGVDDKEDFHELVKKMDKGGFDEEMRTSIFQSVAAVLLLGNMEIKGDQSSSKVSKDKCVTDACELLGISEDKLCDTITHSFLKTKDNVIKKDVSVVKALAARDSVAKIVYSRMFDFIITTVDRNLRGDLGNDGHALPKSIGILDIFGFEDMSINGFEQMFINLANERIQHLFNTIMFEREKITYEQEGISSDFLQFPSNLKCVEMFTSPQKPRGIVGLLQEACEDVKDADKVDGEHFVTVLNARWGKADHFHIMDFRAVNNVMKAKGLKKKGSSLNIDWKTCFGIKHYAGDIMYTVENFVPKSANSVTNELEQVLRASSIPVIKNFLDVEQGNATTVGQAFSEQLQNLATELDSGDTLFVRCIKSNPGQLPMDVDRGQVLEQLVRGGVVAALEMRQAGLPYHLSYAEFREEFGILERGRKKENDKEVCQAILRELRGQEDEDRNQFKFGNTRVFMKSELHNLLHAICRFKMNYFSNKIMRNLDKNRMKKFNKYWDKFLAVESEAQENAIEDLKTTLTQDFLKFKKGERVTVGAILSSARGAMEPAKNDLEASKAKNNGDMAAVAQDMQPHTQVISGMMTMINVASEVVNVLTERKRQVKGALYQRVNRGIAALWQQLEIIQSCEDDCDACVGADPDDVANCKKACTAARVKVEALKTKDVPDLLHMSFESSHVKLDSEGVGMRRTSCAGTVC